MTAIQILEARQYNAMEASTQVANLVLKRWQQSKGLQAASVRYEPDPVLLVLLAHGACMQAARRAATRSLDRRWAVVAGGAGAERPGLHRRCVYRQCPQVLHLACLTCLRCLRCLMICLHVSFEHIGCNARVAPHIASIVSNNLSIRAIK